MIYLDSAATSQTPKEVLDAMGEYYRDYRANVHRGVYDASVKATQQYEAARSAIAKFINADSREIIFNSGATAGLNQLAYSLSPRLSHRDFDAEFLELFWCSR
jgi:selenocysteine lyase/cysteine desulfurase